MKVKEVLLGSGELPKQPPIEDSAFIDYARKVDRLYSQASRWLLQEPYLWEYESIAWRDVRGYYFLHKELQLEKELRAFASLDAPTRDRLKGLLVILCTNSQESRQSCKQGLEAAIQKRAVYDFFNHYDRDGSDLWSSYFKIQNARSDANFSKANPDLFLLPFVQPETQEIAAFLSDNIQDEWRFGPWKLNLAFQSGSSEMAHVVFVPGATPHVNGLGGSEITMDANRPLTDYTARWTIRHEFGHVLGFPDCYTEFYDSEKQAMVQYQLDITNLMCSRRGHLQEQHVEELKRAYF